MGITFKDKFERDPFVFVANGLLLRMLYALTRPSGVKATPVQKIRRVDPFAPAPTFVALHSDPWGKEAAERTSRS